MALIDYSPEVSSLVSYAQSLEKETDRLRAAAASADAFERENMQLRELLRLARAKLELYCAGHSGEYIGGMEYNELIRRIDAAL